MSITAKRAPRDRGPNEPVLASTWHGLGVIVITFAAMVLADLTMSYVLVFAAFGAFLALLIVPVVLAILAAVMAAVAKAFTGRRRVPGAIVIAALHTGLCAAGFVGMVGGNLRSFTLGDDAVVHLAVAGLCALGFGLFLGPWPLRILGGAALLAVPILLSALPTDAERIAERAAEEAAQERAVEVERYIADGTPPFITELEGWENVSVRPTGSSAGTTLLSDDDASATVMVERIGSEGDMDPAYPCMRMSRGDGDSPAVDGELPEWCVKTDTGWERADGLAAAYMEGDHLVIVEAAAENSVIATTEGWRSATPEEIAALSTTLRPMTDMEIEQWVLPVYDSVRTLDIDTPGL
ncbi:hypothetical protein [Microbacterium luteum]|uniref:hypothetical protein n=1 Tax=Microbacterium luteum TaxID=2782167 RepID=UPI00188931E0|nr:hypothetical protein [Microbacterium luteum]